jgi:hypothetical protein
VIEAFGGGGGSSDNTNVQVKDVKDGELLLVKT